MAKDSIEVLNLKQFSAYLQPRKRDAHKGHFGHVLIVGGDHGYSGAVRLAAEAALRVGAGLVSCATRSEHAAILNATRPEIMCHGIASASDIEPLLDKCSIIVAGPGMGSSGWARKLLHLILKSDKPIVLDADGLNILSIFPEHRSHWILTPHPGEAARLLKTSTEDIQKNRLETITLLQQKFGGVCVLKGTGSLVIGEDHVATMCQAGNPGMATAGMGDILSGVIGALLAQHVPLLDAAKLGVLIHAMAGDLAACDKERGLIASDLMPHLRNLINSCRF